MKRLYIPLPDAPARKQIVLNLMKQQPFHLTEDELDAVCNRTEGWSYSEVARNKEGRGRGGGRRKRGGGRGKGEEVGEGGGRRKGKRGEDGGQNRKKWG